MLSAPSGRQFSCTTTTSACKERMAAETGVGRAHAVSSAVQVKTSKGQLDPRRSSQSLIVSDPKTDVEPVSQVGLMEESWPSR